MTPHGVGIDVVELARFARLVERYQNAFIGRWFTAQEQSDSARTRTPIHDLAARFALKEAVWKSIGVGSRSDPVPWRTIETNRDPTGQWRVSLDGIAARHARGVATTTFLCSTSTSDSVAIAIAHAYRSDETIPATGQTTSPGPGD